MKRGVTIKQETDPGFILERRMITRSHRLEWLRQKCVGCDICSAACPLEAITLQRGGVENGRLVVRPSIDIDEGRCNFCGECVILCPTNALRITVDGEPKIPVLEYEAFPSLVKEISVNVVACRPSCKLACRENCPPEVIEVETATDARGRVKAILDVRIDRAECIYCNQCAVACPEGAISVTKPMAGRVYLDRTRCPKGCQACVDICPTDALLLKKGEILLDERFCLYCGACQVVCPEEGAIRIERRYILHSPVESGAWLAALEKLTSVGAMARELDVVAQARRRGILNYLPAVDRKNRS